MYEKLQPLDPEQPVHRKDTYKEEKCFALRRHHRVQEKQRPRGKKSFIYTESMCGNVLVISVTDCRPHIEFLSYRQIARCVRLELVVEHNYVSP